MTIRISETTQKLIQDDFMTLPAGEVDIKGFGVQQTFSLESELRHR